MPLGLISSVYSKNPNKQNIFSRSFSLIPMPVSSTWISKTPFFASLTTFANYFSSWNVKSYRQLTYFADILTLPPFFENFKAFETKLIRTCCSLCLSVHTIMGKLILSYSNYGS